MSNKILNSLTKYYKGVILCLIIAIPSYFLGKQFPIIGGAVIAIILGMIVNLFFKDKSPYGNGIQFVSKKVLQWAVILLGFGMNLSVILKTGRQSLPIIVSTIATSLIIAFLLHKILHIPGKISTLVGVGSSICGGSAIAATAPVIDADDDEVAQAISVIFFFNVLAAILFPPFGNLIGFSTQSGEAFGIFAGTAVNDTSSVTSCAATWDSMWNLGSQTLDTAVTVKLTRTLAIIPITLVLAFLRTKKTGRLTSQQTGTADQTTKKEKVKLKKIFPFFILYFILASVITTVAINLGANADVFKPVKELSKFFIILAMAAIGLNTNVVKLIKTGGKPLIMGFCCWVGIAAVSLCMQFLINII
ncbi:MAG: YeiH family putative sulfate export transporter [Lachnospiraceae bacterium]|nr:YeiH family putative sulfate export transporter [Lachnospiraceae bacterium]